MQVPLKPVNEYERISTLRALSILDTRPEERFDCLTRLTKRIFNVPIVLISLVDEDRQWFKSSQGLSVSETPRDISFCAHAILGDDILVIPDTLADERFFDNPLVTGAPYIRFYAGCPLHASNGVKLGTLCLIDVAPRHFSAENCETLRDLTKMVEQEMTAVRLAIMDEMTQLFNRRGFDVLAQRALNLCKRMDKPVSLLLFDLNDFKKINDTYGHAEGDHALIVFADLLKNTFRESDIIGRLGGDEFVVLLTGSNNIESMEVVTRLQCALDAYNNSDEQRGYLLSYSVGQAEYDDVHHVSIAQLFLVTDEIMYKNKQESKSIAQSKIRH